MFVRHSANQIDLKLSPYDGDNSVGLNFRAVLGVTFMLYSMILDAFYGASVLIDHALSMLGVLHLASVGLSAIAGLAAVARTNRQTSSPGLRILALALMVAAMIGARLLGGSLHERTPLLLSEVFACGGLFFLRI